MASVSDSISKGVSNIPKSCSSTLFTSHKSLHDIKKWVLIDADGLTLGKVAVVIADLLRGKSKPCYTPHSDCGDYVVVVNADKVFLSGNKEIMKKYYRHSGYLGGLKTTNVKTVRNGKQPELILQHAVKGMVGSGKMARQRLLNLHLYSGPDHCHHGQKPSLLDVKSLHKKHSNN